MLGTLLRTIVILVVLVGAGAFLLGWWGSDRIRNGDGADTVGTTGVDTSRAREVGAQVGERTAAAAEEARRAVANGSTTGKIRAKMALDDTIKALSVDVDTNGSTVTVSGTVATEAQKNRILQLARETDGVTQVVDKLTVRR